MLWCIPTMCVCAFLVCSVCTSFRLGEGAKLAKPPMLISRCLLHAAERPPPPAPTSECLLQQLFLVIISTELFNTLSSPHSLYLPLYSLSGALKGSSNDIMFIAATFHSDFFSGCCHGNISDMNAWVYRAKQASFSVSNPPLRLWRTPRRERCLVSTGSFFFKWRVSPKP